MRLQSRLLLVRCQYLDVCGRCWILAELRSLICSCRLGSTYLMVFAMPRNIVGCCICILFRSDVGYSWSPENDRWRRDVASFESEKLKHWGKSVGRGEIYRRREATAISVTNAPILGQEPNRSKQ